jgi:putative tryptophan/tyrosine transport system substrate-binding protein
MVNSISCNPALAGGDRMQFDQLKRREFITLFGGVAARAQQFHRVPRIGVLLPGTPRSFAPWTQAFVGGLRVLGYVEGRTIAIEWKWGQDRVDRLPNLAAELVGSQVDVIVTGGTPAARALKNCTLVAWYRCHAPSHGRGV